MATISKIGKKYYVRYNVDGVQKRYKGSFNTYEEALKVKQMIENKILWSNFKVKDLKSWYVDYRDRKGYRRASMGYMVGVFVSFLLDKGITYISEINLPVLKEFINDMRSKRKISTVNNYIGLIKTIFNTLLEEEIITDEMYNAVGVRKLRAIKDVKGVKRDFITSDDVRLLLDNLSGEYYKLFLFLISTGCRIGEALYLEKNNIDFENDTIAIIPKDDFVPKSTRGIKYRYIPIYPSLKDKLLEWVESCDRYIFFTTHVREGAYELFRLKLVNLSESLLGKKVTPHDLRRYFASVMLNENNVPVSVVKELLGHSDIKTTMKYIRTSSSIMKLYMNKAKLF